jgi:hypothetical protein
VNLQYVIPKTDTKFCTRSYLGVAQMVAGQRVAELGLNIIAILVILEDTHQGLGEEAWTCITHTRSPLSYRPVCPGKTRVLWLLDLMNRTFL